MAYRLPIALGFLTAAFTTTPWAAEISREQILLDILLTNKNISPEQHQLLSKAFANDDEVNLQTLQAAAESAPGPKPAKTPDSGRVSVKDGLKLESDDGQFALALGGRLQADAALYDEDERSLGNGTSLRRARVKVAGTFYRDWHFKAEYDFAGNRTSIADAFLEYSGFDSIKLRAGHFKIPLSLENQMSTNDIAFMERSLTLNALTPSIRRVGLGADTSGSNWSLSTGIFGESVSGDFSDESDSGWSFATRATTAAWRSENGLLHLGAGVEYRNSNDSEGFRFSSRPESNVTNLRLIDTGTIFENDDMLRYGAEAALAMGPWWIQAEYLGVDLSRDTDDLNFDGWYAQTGWFVTGESRPYDVAGGKFKSVSPQHGFGALELALRFSTVDLNDGPLTGGDADSLSAAINWYINKRLRFSFNYIEVLNHDNDGAADKDEPSALTARAQVVF